ncbi:hypothetical protein RR45_GL000886 [Lactococcus chungangensis CAU 28 = DSM 22330]|uniref:Processed acidic surface protein n=1 Tax=Pseudolactococcus chungangensis CAU 28 = DSM 22330 TaxID=1122154 RepID=A0A1K2H5N5_9LACT|nr:hypothetical protein [Lactococcus chungangensis]PCS04571.1 hypothetical protein RR45_GL000886 [Lactococcus chungangensis CAU 28 = DSM 22330]SFZ71535.1 hypothetical protein SAMN02746068_00427 [Lactococcus chungangensis CAU 28 = DSM 22330]
MGFSKSKKALAAVTIATALTGAAVLAAPTDFSGTLVAQAATQSINFSQVDAALAKYNTLVEADYTATSWANFNKLVNSENIKAFKKMISEMKTETDAEIEEAGSGTIAEVQAGINSTAVFLNEAMDTVLVKKSEVANINLTGIKTALGRYKALKESDYTPASWAAFKASLVDQNGAPFDVNAYEADLADFESLTPDEVVYFLRITGMTATQMQESLDHDAALINASIDLLVAGATTQPTATVSKNLPTTSAPKGAVAKTNATPVAKASTVAPLALLTVSALSMLGSVTYKIRNAD